MGGACPVVSTVQQTIHFDRLPTSAYYYVPQSPVRREFDGRVPGSHMDKRLPSWNIHMMSLLDTERTTTFQKKSDVSF